MTDNSAAVAKLATDLLEGVKTVLADVAAQALANPKWHGVAIVEWEHFDATMPGDSSAETRAPVVRLRVAGMEFACGPDERYVREAMAALYRKRTRAGTLEEAIGTDSGAELRLLPALVDTSEPADSGALERLRGELGDGDAYALLRAAAELVVTTQYASPSMLARKLDPGVGVVADLINALADFGVVAKPRRAGGSHEVLVPPDGLSAVMANVDRLFSGEAVDADG